MMKRELFLQNFLKEIEEQGVSMRATLAGRIISDDCNVKLPGLETISNKLRCIDKLYIVGRGTSYHAGLVGEYLFEELAGVRAKAFVASGLTMLAVSLPRNASTYISSDFLQIASSNMLSCSHMYNIFWEYLILETCYSKESCFRDRTPRAKRTGATLWLKLTQLPFLPMTPICIFVAPAMSLE